MHDPVTLLVYLLIIGLVIYITNWIVGMLTLPPQVKTVILIIVAVLGLLWIIQSFGFTFNL